MTNNPHFFTNLKMNFFSRYEATVRIVQPCKLQIYSKYNAGRIYFIILTKYSVFISIYLGNFKYVDVNLISYIYIYLNVCKTRARVYNNNIYYT